MRDSVKTAIREAVRVPDHIAQAGQACASDLLNGPRYARMPESGKWEDFGEDDWSALPEDLAGNVSQVYSGPIGDMLRDFISNLPTLYLDEDGFASVDEPQGEDVDGEWIEAPAYSIVDGRQVVEGLFGQTIAREFR